MRWRASPGRLVFRPESTSPRSQKIQTAAPRLKRPHYHLFGGSFVFSAAAVALGRRAIACDMDPHWCEVGRERCRLAEETGQIVTRARRAPKPGMPPECGPRIRQLDLFSGLA